MPHDQWIPPHHRRRPRRSWIHRAFWPALVAWSFLAWSSLLTWSRELGGITAALGVLIVGFVSIDEWMHHR